MGGRWRRKKTSGPESKLIPAMGANPLVPMAVSFWKETTLQQPNDVKQYQRLILFFVTPRMLFHKNIELMNLFINH